jgi:hypothetical protein
MIKDSRIESIKNAAHKLGACGMEKNISSYRGLAQLLFSPRGSEFCAKQNFPTLELFQKIKNEAATCGVYTDAGNIHLSSRKNLCLAGDTSAFIKASGTKYIHTIILMHGASATIDASNYAVLKVINISGSNVKINKDKTVVVL